MIGKEEALAIIKLLSRTEKESQLFKQYGLDILLSLATLGLDVPFVESSIGINALKSLSNVLLLEQKLKALLPRLEHFILEALHPLPSMECLFLMGRILFLLSVNNAVLCRTIRESHHPVVSHVIRHLIQSFDSKCSYETALNPSTTLSEWLKLYYNLSLKANLFGVPVESGNTEYVYDF